MKFPKSMLAGVALVASLSSSASAQVGFSLTGGVGPFLGINGPVLGTGNCTVGTPCTLTLGPTTVGNFVGGTVYGADQPFAEIPDFNLAAERFIAAGPSSNGSSVLTFSKAIWGISFLWGSPDARNTLKVNVTGGGSQTFSPGTVGLGGDGYVTFFAVGPNYIQSMEFSNVPNIDAFETSRYALVTPEPSSYLLMATGLLALGIASKRRKRA